MKAIFLAHSRTGADRAMAEELAAQLRPLGERAAVSFAGQIAPGAVIAEEEGRLLAAAQVVVCLLTVDLLNDEALVQRLVARQRSGQAELLLVLVSACAWEYTALGALTKKGQPLTPVLADRPARVYGDAERAQAWQQVLKALRPLLGEEERVDPVFTWLHLSDLHAGHGGEGHAANQELVLEGLARDVGGLLKQGLPQPQALLVTGDVAFSGGDRGDEYALAETMLGWVMKEAGLGKQDVYLVPGNHDVQWSAEKGDRNLERLLGLLRSGGEDLDRAVAEAGDRALLRKRQARFLKFAGGYAPVDGEGLWWQRWVRRGSLLLRLVGWNSALLAAGEDQGKLRLGQRQLRETLGAGAAGEVVLVLSHHPLTGGWLADEKDAGRLLRSRAHLHLTGHVHEAESRLVRDSGGQEMVTLCAGAVHNERGAPPEHGYSLASLLPRAGGGYAVRVWPRRWSERKMAFQEDLDHIPRENIRSGKFYAEHALREE